MTRREPESQAAFPRRQIDHQFLPAHQVLALLQNNASRQRDDLRDKIETRLIARCVLVFGADFDSAYRFEQTQALVAGRPNRAIFARLVMHAQFACPQSRRALNNFNVAAEDCYVLRVEHFKIVGLDLDGIVGFLGKAAQAVGERLRMGQVGAQCNRSESHQGQPN